MNAVNVLNPGAPSHILLLGDHAGREIPVELAGLGLDQAALQSHIAWDIGVAGLGEALAALLNATFISQRFSRLVIDCNRDPASADSIVAVSDAIPIPGNIGLTVDGRALRRRRVFDPYHDRIAGELDARGERRTILLALHSFAPSLSGGPTRPWRFGLLHLGSSKASQRVLDALRAELGPDLVGDNEPYRMDETDYTVPRHAIARGLDYIELEVRQDVLEASSDQVAAAQLLATCI
jgi:predicted N-formylglutamate amidohydrolase